MRANINAITELPIKLDQFIEEITRLSSLLENTTIWQAEVTAQSDRDGHPAELALTLTGNVEPADQGME